MENIGVIQMFVENLNSYSDFSNVVNEALNEKLTKELNENGYFAELEYFQNLKNALQDVNEKFQIDEIDDDDIDDDIEDEIEDEDIGIKRVNINDEIED